MAGDFNKPSGSSPRASFMTEIRDMFADMAKMFSGTSTANYPTSCIRHNSSAKRREKYNGAAWDELDVTGEKVSRVTDGTNILKMKVIDIGDWNMDVDPSKYVAHGLTDHTKVRSVSALIRDDTGGTLHVLPAPAVDLLSLECAVLNVSNSSVGFLRKASGAFDSTGYDSTSFNRGWMTIWYVE